MSFWTAIHLKLTSCEEAVTKNFNFTNIGENEGK